MKAQRLIGLVGLALIVTAAPAVSLAEEPDPGDAGATTRIAPGDADRGAWRLRTDDGVETVEWRSPSRLPVTDGRPEFRLGDRVIGYPDIGADRRTLSLPDVDLTAGQIDRLEVWLGDNRLDTVGDRDLQRIAGAAAAPVGPTAIPAVDPGEPGDHPITRFDYRSAPLPWREYPAPLETVGHAVLPADVDGAPLVLFLHGRHQACYGPGDDFEWPCAGRSKPVPSQLGYDYLQRMLASQGYATVSIAANAINQQDWRSPDGGASARSALVRHHLELLGQWTADLGRPRWFGRLDLNQVVLVGHSRGGEGVDQAVIDTRAGAPYTVEGQVLIGPVDFAYQTAGYMPTVVLLPYCDGDVYDLQGQRYVDAAATLTSDDPTLRSSVLMRGANHNFFNTEWTPGISKAPSFDDWGDQQHPLCGRKASPTRLSPAEQRRAARSFVGAAVHGFVESDPAALDLLDSARPVKLPAAGGAVAWTHALGGDRDTVRPGADARVTGAATTCRSGTVSSFASDTAPGLCGSGVHAREVHWTLAYRWWLGATTPYKRFGLTRQLMLEWTRPGTVGGLNLDQPMDLSGPGTSLDLRLVTDPTVHPTRLAVRLTDGDGSTWTAPDVAVRRLPGGEFLVAMWARTVRVDVTDAPADLDLTDIRAIDLVARSASGHVWLLDASARRPAVSPAPGTQLPSIRFGNVRVREGDAARNATAELPYLVLGEVTEPARFAVAMDRSTFGRSRPYWFDVVTVQPGTTSGVLEVPYESDRLDDPRRSVQFLYGVPLKGLAMGDYIGRLRVEDDDPTPRLRFESARPHVRYGAPMRFVWRLSAPVDYDVFGDVSGLVLDRLRPLRVADVPERWARRHIPHRAPQRAALARWINDFVRIDAGDVRGVFEVPTRAHPPHPNPKSLTLRLRSSVLEHPIRATVRVR
jgi:hypothetical protein